MNSQSNFVVVADRPHVAGDVLDVRYVYEMRVVRLAARDVPLGQARLVDIQVDHALLDPWPPRVSYVGNRGDVH